MKISQLFVLVTISAGMAVSTVARADATSITVSAAASLKESIEEISTLYKKQAPDVSVSLNLGGSGALEQQIEKGAPVDVFVSAANKQMDQLETKKLVVAGTRKDLLSNKLVLITPKGTSLVHDFSDLTTAAVRKIAMGEPEAVPAGKYAKETLTSLGLYDQLQSKLVFGKDVRQVLSYVGSGNADAGFVYLTDAMESRQIEVVKTAPESSHSPIVYPVATVHGHHEREAAGFVKFLSTPGAMAVFKKHGFTPAK